MSAISMPEMTTGMSAFGTLACSSLLNSSLVSVDAQLAQYVTEPRESAFGTHAAATASVPASDSNRKWGRPPRGEPR